MTTSLARPPISSPCLRTARDPLRRLAAGAGRLARATGGAAAVEFGLVGAVFILLFCFWLELGLTTMMQTSLDNATRDAARKLRVGAVTTSAAFVAALCKDLSALMSCSAIQYNVVSADTFAALSTAVTTNGANQMTGTKFLPGTSGQDVVVQVAYTRTVTLPIVDSVFGSSMLIVSTFAFQNEPY